MPSAVFFEGADLQYLFRIEEDGYFLMKSDGESVVQQLLNDGYFWESTRNLRDLEHKELAFAASTAHHLYNRKFFRIHGNLIVSIHMAEKSQKQIAIRSPWLTLIIGNIFYLKHLLHIIYINGTEPADFAGGAESV